MNALLLTDLQNDFCPGGALAVEEGDRVVPVANALAADPDNPWSPPVQAELQALDCDAADFEQLRLDLAGDLDETLTAAATPSPSLV